MYVIVPLLLQCSIDISMADEDARQLVQLPEMMQEHMLSKMRDHLESINEILVNMQVVDWKRPLRLPKPALA